MLTHRAGWGGAELALLEIIEGLSPEEWKLTAAVSPGPFCDRLAAREVRVEPVHFPAWRKGRDCLRSWIFLKRMSRLAARVSAQLVFAGDIRSAPFAVQAAKQNRCPCLVLMQDSTIQPRHIKAYRVHWADQVLCPSRDMLELVRSGGVPPERTLFFPLGIDTNRFNPSVDGSQIRAQWTIRDNALLIGCIGSISHLKGQDILLEAMLPLLKENRNLQLVFVGSGKEKFIKKLKDRVGPFGGSGQIRFTGWREDIPAVLAAMDIVVMASRSELFPRAPSEAMAIGKPVIATQTGAVEDLFDKNQCGLSVPVGDVSALREALLRLLGDTDLRRRLGRAGANRIRTAFSMKAYQMAFRDALRSLCDTSGHAVCDDDEIR